MKKYAKIVNQETKRCEVGTGTNTKFYQSIGMTQMDVEQGYDGNWYVAGYAPAKPVEELQAEVRAKRNALLDATDKYVSVPDFPIDEETRELYKQYRTYLRDYTESENWWLSEPLDFDAWCATGSENVSETPESGSENVQNDTETGAENVGV